ncbi:MAG TPA: hydrolase, partial [Kribbellaceae bacterium]|nr:hydrolase [Kribbellaceae bacterium]
TPTPTPTPPPTGNLLKNPGFESGNVSWSATAGVIDNSSGKPAHSGSWKAWLDGYGSSHTDSLSQSVAIPSTVSSAALSFWIRIDTGETTTSVAYDTLKVQVVDGTSTTTLATYSNLNKNTTYTQKTFDLSAYKGKTVTVKFLGVEDSSLQTSFVIDDTAVSVG